MTISEKKNFERKIFRNLMGKSSLADRRNVEINVRLYVESFLNSGKNINHIGIYWPLKNEVDIRSLNDKYSLAYLDVITIKNFYFVPGTIKN